MKTFITGLVLGLALVPVVEPKAEILEDEDHTYLGFQLSIPLHESAQSKALANAEYSLLLVNRNDGISEGLVWTHDETDTRTFGYLRPSSNFLLGKSHVSDHTLPLLRSNGSGEMSLDHLTHFDGGDLLMYTIGGIYVISHVLDDAWDDLFDSDDEEPDGEIVEE